MFFPTSVPKTFGKMWHMVEGKGKIVPVLNQASCHEDVFGVWRYSSMHS
jgi:hypothetical protein